MLGTGTRDIVGSKAVSAPFQQSEEPRGRKSMKHMYGLLTKCEVKMAGYWPRSFFCVFMDREGVAVHKLEKK